MCASENAIVMKCTMQTDCQVKNHCDFDEEFFIHENEKKTACIHIKVCGGGDENATEEIQN